MDRMSSDWVTSHLNWQLKVKNSESGLYKVINKLDKVGLTESKATDINLKVHLHLDRGPRLVAHCNNVGSIVGNSQDVFPLIQLGDQFGLEFSPTEPEEAGFGLGFIPFLVNAGEGESGGSVIPDFDTIKSSISDTFNNTNLVKMRKKHSTWNSAITQGSWDRLDPKYIWPTYGTTADTTDEQGMFSVCNYNVSKLINGT